MTPNILLLRHHTYTSGLTGAQFDPRTFFTNRWMTSTTEGDYLLPITQPLERLEINAS